MKDNRGTNFLSVIILLAIAGGAYFLVQSIQNTTAQTVMPFQQANSGLQTQVSDLMHPTPTVIPDPATYINQIQALARLETIEYSVSQVVTVEVNQGTFAFLTGNKILLEVHGSVIAGVDMAKIQPGDLHIQNGQLTVNMPAAEVFVTTLDESKTKEYDIQNGLFSKPSSDLVLNGLQGAKDQIYKAAIDDGILEAAQRNAAGYLTRFFAALGYPNAVLHFPPGE